MPDFHKVYLGQLATECDDQEKAGADAPMALVINLPAIQTTKSIDVCI